MKVFIVCFIPTVSDVWMMRGCCLSTGISFFHLDLVSSCFSGSRWWCGQCSLSQTAGPYPQPWWVQHTPTHFHTPSALMFFVRCPVERCELSFIDLRYRVSVLSQWNGCPLSSLVWLEPSPFIEVVEKDSATRLKVVIGYFVNRSSAVLIATGRDIFLSHSTFSRQDVILHVSGCVHARTCSGSFFPVCDVQRWCMAPVVLPAASPV